MTHNLHLLTHLSRDLFLFGPAWTHIMFRFEGYNHILNKKIHTTGQYEKGAIIEFNMKPKLDNYLHQDDINPKVKNVNSSELKEKQVQDTSYGTKGKIIISTKLQQWIPSAPLGCSSIHPSEMQLDK